MITVCMLFHALQYPHTHTLSTPGQLWLSVCSRYSVRFLLHAMPPLHANLGDHTHEHLQNPLPIISITHRGNWSVHHTVELITHHMIPYATAVIS